MRGSLVSGLNHHGSRVRAGLSIEEVTASIIWEMAEAQKLAREWKPKDK